MATKLNATQLLEKVLDLKATDLHLSVGAEPHVRVNTLLRPLEEYSPLSTDDIEYILSII